ncbi:MAG: bifunctional methylenetetrahydrofolate dehydrogenase/methenyltetrahydrofolate cyclohydrolase FolD [Acidobacteriota bacterium]|nr:MAG: bifunctional methylenetetrahydrofolate dehydrogenase/methenyltetrahydrofolate cyclohydrolase FolD [Acidobacteriota bacterium]
MAARILDGKALARSIQQRLAEEVSAFADQSGRAPGMAVVLIGDDPASAVYVRNKEKAARKLGMHSEVVRLPDNAAREQVLAAIARSAEDPLVDGMLVQLPVPPHLDPVELQHAVPASKDVDGLHPANAGRLLLGQPGGLIACTPRGVMAVLEHEGVELEGAQAVIVGRSNIVGKPLSLLLLARHATVTLCHSRTRDLAAVCRRADVLVAAVGVPGLIGLEHIKPGAVVIDVGTNSITDPALAERLLAGQLRRLERFRDKAVALVGDVQFAAARERAACVTPVPGGIGPLTVTMLLENTLIAARYRQGREQRRVGDASSMSG